MLSMYLSSNQELLQKGRLWRITSPEGIVNYVFASIHVQNSDLLLSGTPEFNAVFNAVDTILFEFAYMQEIHKEAQSALEGIFKVKIPNLHFAYNNIKPQCKNIILSLFITSGLLCFIWPDQYQGRPITFTLLSALVNLSYLIYRLLPDIIYMEAVSRNCRPAFSPDEMLSRIETLYTNGNPNINRNMLTQFMQAREGQQLQFKSIYPPLIASNTTYRLKAG